MLKYLLCCVVVIAFCLPALPLENSSRSNAAGPRPGRKYATLERLKPERLRAVSEDRQRYQRSRTPVTLRTGYQEYRAILHAHAEDSSHTGGTRPELLAAAKKAGVNIILLSDHVRPPRDFINDSWRGVRDGVLFIPGAESEGFVVHPMRSIIAAYRNKSWKTPQEYVQMFKRVGGNIFLSHVEDKLDWETSELDGLEIYNNHTDFKDELEFLLWLRGSLIDPKRLKQLEQSLSEFPMEFFGASQDYLAPIIAKWDLDSQKHRLTGIAANDCHHNQLYVIKAAASDAIEINVVGDPPRRVTTQQSPDIAELLKDKKPGEVITTLDFDPYERSFNYVSTHILLREFNEKAVRQALRQSHVYVAHDWLCDPTGFALIVERQGKAAGVMGDEVGFEKGLQLRLAAPATGMIKLYRDGSIIQELRSDKLDFDLAEPGIYRAEIWLEIDGEQRPWIYANPIRLRPKNK